MIPRCPSFLIVTCVVCLSLGSRSVQARSSIEMIAPLATTTSSAKSSPFWTSPWFLGGVGVSGVVGAATLFALNRRRSTPEILEPLSSNPMSLPPQPLALSETKEEVAATLEKVLQNSPSAPNGNGNGHSAANGNGAASLSIAELPLQREQLNHPISESPKIEETTKLAKINIVEELIQDLRSPDPAKRHKVIWEIGQRGDTRAVQPLVDLLVDSDSKQRSLILSALSEIGTRTLKPMTRALAISLQDENSEVRKNAIRDLTRVYDMVAQISNLLHKATDDPDRDVQETARWALGQLNRIRSVPELPSMKNSVSPPENLP